MTLVGVCGRCYKTFYFVADDPGAAFTTPHFLWNYKLPQLGNWDKFYFTFVIVHRNRVQIVRIIDLDQIPICHLSN
jgi:hypothetical protein